MQTGSTHRVEPRRCWMRFKYWPVSLSRTPSSDLSEPVGTEMEEIDPALSTSSELYSRGPVAIGRGGVQTRIGVDARLWTGVTVGTAPVVANTGAVSVALGRLAATASWC
eukprot:3640838-Rhodomonas_salina.2